MSTIVVAVGATLASTSVSAADNVAWNFSTWGGPRALTKGFEAVADYVKEKTDGNFIITIAYGETLSPAKENLDNVSIGAIEAANFCTSYHPGKNPIATVLDLPFLPFPNFDVQVAVHDAFQSYGPYVKEMENWNAKPWFSSVLPQYEFMGVGDPPKKLEDWNGMRVRALGGQGDAMRKLGAVPTTVPAPEVYQSMERGVVQAAGFPFTFSFGAFRVHEVAKWFTEGIQIGSVNCPVVMNKDAYESLPTEYQAIIDDAPPIAYEAYRAAYTDADKKWLPIFKERLETVTYSPEELARFRKIGGQPVWDEWVAAHKGEFDSAATLKWVLDTAAKASADQPASK